MAGQGSNAASGLEDSDLVVWICSMAGQGSNVASG